MRIDPLASEVLAGIADVLGETNDGLSNKEIRELLTTAGIADPTPKPPSQYHYIAISKRDRIHNALLARQQHDGAGNAAIHFVECTMAPGRYLTARAAFADRKEALNEVLAFAGLQLNDQGNVSVRGSKARTIDEARARSRRLRRLLTERGVHQRVLASCAAEIGDENYFHTVLEAAKSLATEIRTKTGLVEDGERLVNRAFEKGSAQYPLLACNKLQSETDWSEQRGLANLLRGVFGAFRNPTTHEPRVQWPLSEADALDALSLISFLHRRLDSCVPSGVAQPPAP